ncbi:DUF2889 domain-containing protein [Polaromonas sp. C04]|uniref:DUF2889 domain-containing protein n=1 Tax=Polaromonas sp. C04 TaxID=1945857 RepID=UPI000987447F|nr:DUF2889 domain-containing protein [Polaromonas sp. C04]OOG51202.1 hypothetical protein B0E49_16435 [Polaromonas sp. C04]
MPLPAPTHRDELHQRQLTMKFWRRSDGLFDAEAHLVDTKPIMFRRLIGEPLAPGAPLHEMWLRIVMDETCLVREVVAASDVTPFRLCQEATASLSVLVGARIGPGWSRTVRERLGGTASCTHLAELMLPLATTALQGLIGTAPHLLEKLGPDGRSRHIDSCYAFAAERDVVKTLWPQHHVR